LVDVYHEPTASKWLYELLKEREPHQSISHKKLPTWEEHKKFVSFAQYKYWYLIFTEHHVCGSVYLTWQDEIGVCVFKQCQGHGVGPNAVALLMKNHPAKRFLANINPANNGSLSMFQRLGFRLIQNTYELKH